MCDSSRGFVAILTGRFCHGLGGVRDIADEAEPITGADHLGAEIGETLMRDRAGLEVADVVRRVMHELHMPDAAPMRLLQPFEFALEEVEPLDIGDNRRLSRLVRRFEIGGVQRAAHAMVGDQRVDPGEAIEVVAVELARLRGASCGKHPCGAAAEHGPVRHVGEAGDGERSCPHRVGEIAARRRLRDDPGVAAVAMDIDGNGVAQDGERRRCGLGGPRRLRRTARPGLAGKHRPDRGRRRARHPGLGRNEAAVTAAIHGVLLPTPVNPAGRYRPILPNR